MGEAVSMLVKKFRIQSLTSENSNQHRRSQQGRAQKSQFQCIPILQRKESKQGLDQVSPDDQTNHYL